MPVTKSVVKAPPKARNKRPRRKKPASQVLYATDHLRLIEHDDHLEVNCHDENQLEKKEFVSFLRHSKKFFNDGLSKKVLVTLSKDWNIDIDAWTMIVRMEFDKISFLKIAFVSLTMHQAILFKHLEQQNFNIRVFPQKTSAVEWLQQDLMTE